MCCDIAGVLRGMAVMSRKASSFLLCMAVATAELWKLAGLGHPHYQLKQLCSWLVPLFRFVLYLDRLPYHPLVVFYVTVITYRTFDLAVYKP
jgi:hypothetical protein